MKYKIKLVEYTRDNVERKFPYCDYEYYPTSEWRYGYAGSKFEVVENEISDVPFSSKAPAITLKTDMCLVDWEYADGYDSVPNIVPVSNKAKGAPEQKTLIPYGCAKLRMTEMPVVKMK